MADKMLTPLISRFKGYAQARLVARIHDFAAALDQSSDEDLGRLTALVLHYRNDVLSTRGCDLLNPRATLQANPGLRRWVEREERLAARVGQPLVALSIGVWVRTLDGTVSPAAQEAVARLWTVLARGQHYIRQGAEEWRSHTGMALDLNDLEIPLEQAASLFGHTPDKKW